MHSKEPLIYDIWFKTPHTLEELAAIIGADVDYADMENHWEWLVAKLDNYKIDITRSHLLPNDKQDTQIFLLSPHRFFPDELAFLISKRLNKAGISPIYMGRWVHLFNYEYEKTVIKEYV